MIRTYFLRWEKHLSSTVTGNITRIGLLSIAYSLMPVTLVSMGMSGEKGDLTYELAFFLLMNVWFIFALITLFDTLCRLRAKAKVNMSSWFDLAYMTLTPIGMWLFLFIFRADQVPHIYLANTFAIFAIASFFMDKYAKYFINIERRDSFVPKPEVVQNIKHKFTGLAVLFMIISLSIQFFLI